MPSHTHRARDAKPRRTDRRLVHHVAEARERERKALGRVYGYTRVSTDMQASDGQSLQVQETQLRGWAMQHSRTIDQIVVEAGVSGGKEFAKRPEGAKLWAELRKGDILVSPKCDRLGRNLFDILSVSQEFQKRGVTLYLLDINGGADPVTGNGQSKMFLSLLGTFAEFERGRIGERIRETKQRQKANGEYLGGPPPFGYSHDADHKLVPIPEQQRAIRRIRMLATEGLSPYKISADLGTRGVKLSHVTVRKIIAGRKPPGSGKAAA